VHGAQAAEVWHYLTAEGEHQAMTALIDTANKASPSTPITDHPVPGSYAGLLQQLQIAFLGGAPPAVWQNNVGPDLATLVKAGRVQPIDDIWEKVGGDKIFPPGLAKTVTVDGHHYAIPINQAVVTNYFYNKKIFADNGLTPPKTWDDLKAICAKLKAASIECIGAASGPWNTYQMYGPMLTSMGVDNYYKMTSGQVPFNGPEMKKAMQYYKEVLVDNYMKDWAGLEWTQTADLLVSGKIAIYPAGDWISAYMKTKGFEPGKDFDLFPAPITDHVISIVQIDSFPLGANISEADAAAGKNFLTAAASAEGQAAFNKIKGSLAVNSETTTDIYDYTGKKEFEWLTTAGNVTLPNMLVLFPAKLLSDFFAAIEQYGANPTDDNLNSILDKLEEERVELNKDNAFYNLN
jgi:ABC-type glycerol-3-phosphate transport system substrate-binding protein